MLNLKKKYTISLIFLLTILAFILIISNNSAINPLEENNNNAEITPKSAGYTYKNVYSVCRWFDPEYKVEDLDALGIHNMGNGVFHIRGKQCLGGTSTTRGALYFGLNNPYYEESGSPEAYEIKCSIRYKHWNDYDGYVKLYVLHDWGVWVEAWAQTDLRGGSGTWTWDISIPLTWPFTEWYMRDDGTMDFKVVGTTWVDAAHGGLLEYPSCQVNIYDLRVLMKYDTAKIRPVGEVYSVCQYFTPEYKVSEIDSLSGSNTGDAVFHIRGETCAPRDSSTTRARFDFGFNNPVYPDFSLPTKVELKGQIRFKNWNDHNGFVRIYAENDNGDFDLIWHREGLDGGTWEWSVSELLDPYYFRSDGSMSFKVVGSSWIYDKWPERPSCQLNIWDLRVKLYYTPTADPGGPYSGNEGESITLDASGSSDPTGNPLWYRWDFNNDGNWDTGWRTNPSINHAWNDDYSGSIRLQVSNGQNTDIHTTNVDIQNVDPIVDLGPDITIDEGVTDFYSYVIITDPGSADDHTMEWDFGDGTPPSTSSSHKFDDGVYTVKVTVTDDDGGVGTDSFVITVNNVDPVVYLGLDRIVNEGYYFYPTILDPGPDTFTYEWLLEGVLVSDLNYFRFNDDGIYELTLKVTDDDGGVGTDSVVITVLNVAPIVDLGLDRTVNEGYLVYGHFIDPGADTHTFTWIVNSKVVSHNYILVLPDDGIYDITLGVFDDDGGVGSDSVVITVLNVAPIANAGPDQVVNEGQSVSFQGGFSDPGSEDSHWYTWNFGDGGYSNLLNPSHTYADNGVYIVSFDVWDDDGGHGVDYLTVTVNNVAPIVDAGPDQTVDEGDTVIFDGTFTDPGTADTHPSQLWDFGDGSAPSPIGSHVYADNNVYTVTFTVTDDDGGVGIDTLTVTVNNVAPIVDAGLDQSVDEGDTVIFSGTFTDPGSADTHLISWDFGDNSPLEDGTLTPTHVYNVPGVYTVTLTVSDDDGGVTSDTLTVTVLDITAPITTRTFLGLYNLPYISSTETVIMLEAEDPESPFSSGVARIEYQLDSTSGPWKKYTGPFNIDLIGAHTLYYRSVDKAGNYEAIQSDDITVNACELTYTGEINGVYSDPTTLEAILIDKATGDLISGKTIVFTLGSQTISAETINGVASVSLILTQPAGDYPIIAEFVNDGEFLGAIDEKTFTVMKEKASAEYTGDMVVPLDAETITLRATVFDEIDGNWGDLTTIYVTIQILNSLTLEPIYTSNPINVEITSVDGVGVAIITIPNIYPEDGYLIRISFDPNENDYYWGNPSDYVTLTIYEPTGDFVTGGGWIQDTDGNKGNFGFNVKYKKNGLPKGQATYVYREGDYTFIIKSNAWVGMVIIPDENYTIFEAKCNIKKVNSITGEIVWEEGNYRLVIEAWDNSKDGKSDVIQIRVYDKIGLIFHEAGYDPYGILGGGNIVIHIDDKK